ncbi:hypothetical protein QF032_001389 [Streptomyces achromogenes]|uniref:hypothetical protein n=1 Tax=Streptomyces achromogenes TaxID=67255 RepID=UPI002786D23E|nr:hypothetical protein [Streptomyces achromogenes]MDQ0829545.1 hypothetical protein [Streptomyces achromogenes]
MGQPADEVKIEIAADMGNTSATLDDAANSLDKIDDAATSASDGLGQADTESGGLAGSMDKVGAASLGAAAAFASMGDIVDSAVDLWNTGEQRADDLARAQNDVAQAALDVKQANVDMRQSQIDANQAQQDGTQAGIDLKQALLDQKTAQKDYNDAVKEFGPKSLEAQQAQIDLAQADADAKQAKLDGKQATEDYSQAQVDGKQAVIDASNAQLDLNEAQRAQVGAGVMGSWLGVVSQVGTALFGLIGTFALFGAETVATAATAVGSAVATAAAWVGGWIAMAASATLSAITMAAAWLLSIWPIALIIAAVIGVAAVIVANWDTIRDATVRIWGAVWTWLQGLWSDIVSGLSTAFGVIKSIFFTFHPLGIIIANWGGITGWISQTWKAAGDAVSAGVRRIGGFLGGMWNGITAGLRGALNGAIGLINSAIGGINSLISGANRVPGVSIPHIPTIPYLAEGGITTGPTMAMIGEGPEQEAVLPLSKLQGLLNKSSGGVSRVVIGFDNPAGDPFITFLQEITRTKGGGSIVQLAEG